MAPPGSGEPEVHRITAAQEPHSDNLEARMGRYLLSMLIRTACFVLMFITHGPMRWVFAVGAIFLPYVAVIFANAGGTRRQAGPAPVTPRGLRQLEAQPFAADPARAFLTGDQSTTALPDDTATDSPDEPAGPGGAGPGGAGPGGAGPGGAGPGGAGPGEPAGADPTEPAVRSAGGSASHPAADAPVEGAVHGAGRGPQTAESRSPQGHPPNG
jgi:hypothetical protein